MLTMREIGEKNLPSRAVYRRIALGFILFPLLALLSNFSIFEWLPILSLPEMKKLHQFNDVASDAEILFQNSRLWYSIVFLKLAWIILIFYIFFFSRKAEKRFRNKNTFFSFLIKGFLIFISIFIFDILFAYGNVDGCRTCIGKPIDYSVSMSIGEYVDWQIIVYFLTIGFFSAIANVLIFHPIEFIARSDVK